MKVRVASKDLKSAKTALAKVAKYGINANNLILKAEQDRLILHQSTRFGCSISLFLDAEVLEQGQVEIEKELLYSLLSTLEPSPTTSIYSTEKVPHICDRILYITESSKALQSYDAGDYCMEIGRWLYPILSRAESVLEYASYLEQRPIDGLHIHTNHAVATNGYQMMHFNLAEVFHLPITIPTAVINLLTKLWKSGNIHICYDCSAARIDHECFSISFPIISNYPPYDSLVSSSYLANAVVDSDLLIPALKEYYKLADKTGVILFRDDCVIIEHKEMPPLYLSAQINGECDIRLNIVRLYEGIKSLKGSLWLALSTKELYNDKHPIIVKEMGNPDFLYLQCPIFT